MKFILTDPFTKKKEKVSMNEFNKIYKDEMEYNECMELEFKEIDSETTEVIGIVEYFRNKMVDTKEFKEIIKLMKNLSEKFEISIDDLNNALLDEID